MSHDRLYRLDPSVAAGARAAWDIPRGDLPLGGVFASEGPPQPPTSDAHVGPHSLQVAPDGAIWITLALGNQLARFDPASERFEVRAARARLLSRTRCASMRAGASGTRSPRRTTWACTTPRRSEQRELRLPARDLGQALIAALDAVPDLAGPARGSARRGGRERRHHDAGALRRRRRARRLGLVQPAQRAPHRPRGSRHASRSR